MNKWYNTPGNQSDVVISTRVRLARNIEEYPFPSRLDREGMAKVNELVKCAVFESEEGKDFSYIDMGTLTRHQAVSLAERHLISAEFASVKEGSGLIISPDESFSIMICEEDHVRLQVMKSGLALEEAYGQADGIDSVLDDKLGYAFDERIGYMTSYPTNLGTAMRASVFLHLPALTFSSQITALANTISKLGLSINGAYGHRNQPLGDIYQVSNRITLGITEKTAIANLKSITQQLANQERNAAAREIKNPALEDKIYRAMGILQSARLIRYDEFMELISFVRLGISCGLIDIPVEKINALIIEMQPATISASYDNIDTITARDAKRAEIVREVFA